MIEYSLNGSEWSNVQPVFDQGINTVHIRQIDVAGNISASSTLTFTLDTIVLAPSVLLFNDTGVSSSDQITQDGQLTVSGTETGAIIEYSTDKQTWNNSFTPVAGSNTVYVRQTDASGNVSQASEPLTFTLDNTVSAPEVALKSDTGIDSSDRLTHSSELELTGVEAGARVQYSLNDSDWSTEQPDFVQGENTLYVRQLDSAGNTSPSSTLSFIQDTLVAAPVITIDGTTVNVTGLETGAITEYRSNGGGVSRVGLFVTVIEMEVGPPVAASGSDHQTTVSCVD